MTLTPTQRTRLAEDHLPLVRALAGRLRSHASPYLEHDDLVAIGAEALLRAARRFDPDRGVPFSSFAYLRARGAMLESIGAVAPYSRGTVRKRAGRPRPSQPLPVVCSLDEQRVALRRAREVTQAMTSAIDAARLVPRVGRALDRLDAHDQQIIRRHYFGGESLLEIGRDLGHSKSWASRLHARALTRLCLALEGATATA